MSLARPSMQSSVPLQTSSTEVCAKESKPLFRSITRVSGKLSMLSFTLLLILSLTGCATVKKQLCKKLPKSLCQSSSPSKTPDGPESSDGSSVSSRDEQAEVSISYLKVHTRGFAVMYDLGDTL